MAESWIKMRTKLRTDPRVWAMSKRLNSSVSCVLGGLFQLWCIADEHGGDLSALDADTLDEMVRIPCFTNALPECWISVKSDGLHLPEYDEHNGSTAKRRALETKQRAIRRKVSVSDTDKTRTREEKRREDKKLTTTTPRKRGKVSSVDLKTVEIPPELSRYESSIRQWFQYKAERNEKYVPSGLKAFFTKCIKKGAALPVAIEHSMSNGYRGIYDAPEDSPAARQQAQGGAKPGW